VSFPEARIAITLRVAQGAVAAVEVQSSRLTNAVGLLAGRPANDVLRLLPTVFSLCGTAQALAGLGAIEAATGLAPAPPHLTARRLLLTAETLAEHGTAMARDWPALMSDTPDLATVKRLRAALMPLRRLLYPDGDWTRPGGGRLAPDRAALHAAIAEAETAIAPLPALAERLFTTIIQDGLSEFGRCDLPMMPANGPADLAERMRDDADGSYCARPDCAGLVYETGPLTRHPAQGNGLLARFAARQAEITRALQDLPALVQAVTDAPNGAACANSGNGLAIIEAARGMLVHRVELTDGTVTRMQILAPTEWNFHPDGAAVRGLLGVAASPDLARQAQLLVSALDPCVACSVAIEEHEHA
jgi:uptake hydrogenase large subunit